MHILLGDCVAGVTDAASRPSRIWGNEVGIHMGGDCSSEKDLWGRIGFSLDEPAVPGCVSRIIAYKLPETILPLSLTVVASGKLGLVLGSLRKLWDVR